MKGINMLDMESKIEDIIQRHTPNKYMIGYSYLEGLLPKKFKRLHYGISIAIKLDDKIINGIKNGPTKEYAQHYKDINSTLNKIGTDIRRILRRRGYKAELIRATLETSEEKNYPGYYKTLSVEFSHKTAATRSGLGWIGKCALLITPIFGPKIRLVTILTNHKFKTGHPVKTDLCGDCEICVKKCPANAASGKSWSADMQREEFFDAHKCRNTALELAQQRLGIDEVMCGICIAVCPIGRK